MSMSSCHSLFHEYNQLHVKNSSSSWQKCHSGVCHTIHITMFFAMASKMKMITFFPDENRNKVTVSPVCTVVCQITYCMSLYKCWRNLTFGLYFRPPINVLLKLPEDTFFFEDPLLARWDEKNSVWRQDGFMDTNFVEGMLLLWK